VQHVAEELLLMLAVLVLAEVVQKSVHVRYRHLSFIHSRPGGKKKGPDSAQALGQII
jgi:hypothetical protein